MGVRQVSYKEIRTDLEKFYSGVLSEYTTTDGESCIKNCSTCHIYGKKCAGIWHALAKFLDSKGYTKK